METRIKKQIFIGFIFMFFIFLIGFSFYLIFRPAPSPLAPEFLKKLQAPEIIWVKFFELNASTYDLAARIKNHNSEHGAESLRYTFNIFDKDNNLIEQISDKTYLLPKEEKYLIRNRVQLKDLPNKIILTFENIEWQTLTQNQQIKLALPVFNPTLKILQEENNFAEVTATLVNQTEYGFDSVQVAIILYEDINKTVPIAAIRTELSGVQPKEERLIRTHWRERFSEPVEKVEVEAYTNLFSDENFL